MEKDSQTEYTYDSLLNDGSVIIMNEEQKIYIRYINNRPNRDACIQELYAANTILSYSGVHTKQILITEFFNNFFEEYDEKTRQTNIYYQVKYKIYETTKDTPKVNIEKYEHYENNGGNQINGGIGNKLQDVDGSGSAIISEQSNYQDIMNNISNTTTIPDDDKSKMLSIIEKLIDNDLSPKQAEKALGIFEKHKDKITVIATIVNLLITLSKLGSGV